MSATVIESVEAREILDNRLEPTVQATVRTSSGSARADVPAGRSRGAREATDLRDGGRRYGGRGVETAVRNVNETIAPAIEGRTVTDQRGIDQALIELDGTEDRANLGGNALTGVSLATLKAGAAATGRPIYAYLGGVNSRRLPVPFLDLIEGGALAATGLAFQEHQVVPTGAECFEEAIRLGAEVYYELGDRLAADWGDAARNVGAEGGYTPPGMTDPRAAFEAELAAIEELGVGDVFDLAIDAAATQFYDAETGIYTVQDEALTPGELIDFYCELTETYPLVSIEDPFHEEDFEAFAELTAAVDAQVIGDDLFVTSTDRLRRGIEAGAADALLLKVNQVGTVTEALDAAELAVRNGYAVQVSERSGQTADTWLADLAVGLNSGQIKTGVSRSERTAQYNRLLDIESSLGSAASYVGDLGVR